MNYGTQYAQVCSRYAPGMVRAGEGERERGCEQWKLGVDGVHYLYKMGSTVAIDGDVDEPSPKAS